MSELTIITRERPADIMEVERSGDGFTVAGIVVPFDRVQEVSDDGVTRYREVFDPHSFDRDVAKGGRWINLKRGHGKSDPGEDFLGRCHGLRAQPEGLWAEFRLERSHPLVDEVRYGELKSWSIGARIYRFHREGDVRRYTMCAVDHVAATPKPQYADAGVVLVRDETVDETPGTPRRDRAMERLNALRSAAERRHPGT